MSTFKGQDLFGSGPHRFATGPHAVSVVPNVLIGGPPPGSTPQGVRELDIVVSGRLVAPSEAALRVLRQTIADLIADPPITGELVDAHGHAWADMSLIEYREAEQTDRGRVRSIAYSAIFRRFV